MNQQKAIDSGLLLLRVVLGGIMLAHGLQKVGVVPGGSIDGTLSFMEGLGFPSWLAWMAIAAELAGGVALILGLFGRLAAFAIAVDMAVALIKVNMAKGFWATNDGLEWPLALFGMATALLIMGMGGASVDAVMAKGMDKTIGGNRA